MRYRCITVLWKKFNIRNCFDEYFAVVIGDIISGTAHYIFIYGFLYFLFIYVIFIFVLFIFWLLFLFLFFKFFLVLFCFL